MMSGGKIARGCQTCRSRKIKCDERRPTCRQCAKACRSCPGYRDDFDIMLRDETQATERRVRKAKDKALALRAMEDAQIASRRSHAPLVDSTHVEAKESRRVSNRISSPPSSSLSEQAACHFLSNYVLLAPQGTERGYLEFLVPILQNNPSPHFRLAFDACGLASLGGRVGTGFEIEKQALKKYTSALASISVAINDPFLSKQDDTLAAVLLLSLFENVTSINLGLLAWGSHTEGAVQLIQRRGPEQTKTKTGRDLFVAVRTQIMIHACTSGRRPALGADFWIRKGAIKDPHGTPCQNITLRITELTVTINDLLTTLSRTPQNIETVRDAIRKCQDYDREYTHWMRTGPGYFQCRTVAWEKKPPNQNYSDAEAFPGRIDAFQDLWVASVWSTFYCTRIALTSLIIRSIAWICSPMDYRKTPEYIKYSAIAADVVDSIVASIPYQLGWFSTRPELLQDADSSTYGCGVDHAAKGLGGYFVTWPLGCVLTQDCSSDAQREWARGRLRHVVDELGIRSARAVVGLNLRFPSMLVLRDSMAMKEGPVESDLDKVLSAQTIPPSGMAANVTPSKPSDKNTKNLDPAPS